tara:strand:+ start:5222 stop:5728 length:507 start_codon:yes stop_codon:yes gene_type:complete
MKIFTPLNIFLMLVILGLVYDSEKNESSGFHENKTVQFDPNIVIVNESKDETEYPYRPRIGRKMPMNIATRGAPRDYETVGYLKNETDQSMQKLFGRETYPGSNHWNYFAMSDDYHQIPIPLTLDNKDCTKENGCKEINDNDTLTIEGQDNKATIYEINPYRYSPYVR